MINHRFLKSNNIYFAGLLLLVAGLPVSLFVTSLSQFILIAAFLFEGNPKIKLKRFLSNKAAILISGIWIFHLIGLFWTTDLSEGMKDLRIKLPLLLLPLIIAGSNPLSVKQFRFVLLAFIASVFAGSMISMAVLHGVIERNISDIRDVFIFHISHIRYALFACLSVYILIWMIFLEGKKVIRPLKILGIVSMLWFLAFLVIVESVTGLVIFSITGFIFLLYYSITSLKKGRRILFTTLTLLLPLCFLFLLNKFVNDYYSTHSYPINVNDKTILGNEYEFQLDNPLYENGYPVWVYVSDKELRSAWNERSRIGYDSLDAREQQLKYTLIRFLSSKGFRKDAEGLSKLSIKEQQSVERGIANVNYQEISSIRARLLQIMWEVDQSFNGGNPSGHSVTQRIEFWKAAIAISSENLLTGVGTGDMPSAYKEHYLRINSSLDEKHRLRAHNQFLAILVALGIPGLLYFIFTLFYPLISKQKTAGFLFLIVFIISILSMLTEDTLETQPGVTFVSLFFSMLLLPQQRS